MKLRLLPLLVLTGLLSAGGLHAQFVWSGGIIEGDGSVLNPANWELHTPAVPVGDGSEDVSFGHHLSFQNNVMVPTSALHNISFVDANRPPYSFNALGGSPTLTLTGNVTLEDGNTVAFNPDLAISLTSGTHTVDVGGLPTPTTQFTVHSNISGAGAITKTGNGTLILTGAGTYAGGTTIKIGTLTVNAGSITHVSADIIVADANGDNGTLAITNGGAVSNSSGQIGYQTDSSGTVTVSGTGSSWTNSAELYVGLNGTGSLTITNGGAVSNTQGRIGNATGSSGSVTVNGAGSSWTNTTFLGVGLNGPGSLTLANSGILNVISGAGTITLGLNSVGAGTLNIGAAAAIPAAGGGILNAAAITTGSGTGTVQFKTTATAVSPYYLTKDGTAGGTAVTITGPTQVINTAGYNVLTGANTYTGGTTINGGTLRAGHNTALGFGSITLNGGQLYIPSSVALANNVLFGASGGILSGNGTVGQAVVVGTNAVLAPGDSPGTLTFTAGLTFAPGGAYDWQIQSATGTEGVNWDFLSVTSDTLNISASPGTRFTLKVISIDSEGDPSPADNFNPASSYSWIIATSDGPIGGFNPANFTINTSAFMNPNTGVFSLSTVGNNLTLDFSPVPEPSTYALLVIGLAFIVIGYRRKLHSSRRNPATAG